MSDLITAVAERLRSAEAPFAVIGAAAMSARGFPRQTLDFDFLVTDRRVLEPGFWDGLPHDFGLRSSKIEPVNGARRR